MSTVRVTLHRIGPCAFEATDGQQHYARLDGSADLEAQILERAPRPETVPRTEAAATPPPGARAGLRPMQMLLVSLAACAAMDIVLILARQRQDLRDLVIEVEGWRVDATPAPFERIHMRFTAHGDVELEKLKRAVELGITKYCSVNSTLKPEVAVEWDALVAPAS